MRYAIVSDIHANLRAWRAVMADIRQQRVDAIVCLGDVVGYGPNPAEVLEEVRKVTDQFVLGNHDAAAVRMMDYSVFNDHARQAIEWTMSRLPPEASQFLSSVPLSIEVGDLLFVHAEVDEPGRFDYVDDVEIAARNFLPKNHFVTFMGHTHMPKVFERSPNGMVVEMMDQNCILDPSKRYIVNVGSVGEPRNAEDIRARYVVYDSDQRSLDFRRVEFDIVGYRSDLQATDLALRPFFLKVYEHAVEGRGAAIMGEGSLVDMRVSHNSAALLDMGRVETVRHVTQTQMLASAQQSKAPKVILLVAAGLAVLGTLVALLMMASDGGGQPNAPRGGGYTPVVDEIPQETEAERLAREAREAMEEKERQERRKERAARNAADIEAQKPFSKREGPDDREVVSLKPDDLPSGVELPQWVKVVEVKKPEIEGAATPPEEEVPEVKEVDLNGVEQIWWRMGEDDNENLVDAEGVLPMKTILKGQRILNGRRKKTNGPSTIPLNGVVNRGAMMLGLWEEHEPSGFFAMTEKNSLTIEGWFAKKGGKDPFILAGTISGNAKGKKGLGWNVYVNKLSGETGKLGVYFFPNNQKGSKAHVVSRQKRILDGRAHHFAVVWDHDHGPGAIHMRLYLDGELVGSQILTPPSVEEGQTNPFRIGDTPWKQRRFSSCILDELRVTKRALTPPEFLMVGNVEGPKMIKGNPNEKNSWESPKNWEGERIPGKKDNAIVGEGVVASLSPAEDFEWFEGALVVGKDATLKLHGDHGVGVLSRPDAKVVLKNGSRLELWETTGKPRFTVTKIGPVLVAGDVEIFAGSSTSQYSRRRSFDGGIEGNGKLTLTTVYKCFFRFNEPSNFSGTLEVSPPKNTEVLSTVEVRATGAFGTGDVVLGRGTRMIVEENLVGVMSEDSTLTLFKARKLKTEEGAKLRLKSALTVRRFFVDGEQMAAGQYNAESHPELVSGAETLTVKEG